MYFLVIVAVFLLAYGITQQAILYPNEPSSWSIVSRVFFRPYFQAHGELFMDAPDISTYLVVNCKDLRNTLQSLAFRYSALGKKFFRSFSHHNVSFGI